MGSLIRLFVGMWFHTNTTPAPAKKSGEIRKHYDLWQKAERWDAAQKYPSDAVKHSIEARYVLKNRVSALSNILDPDDDLGEPLEDFVEDVPVGRIHSTALNKLWPFGEKSLVFNVNDCSSSSSISETTSGTYRDPAWVPDESM